MCSDMMMFNVKASKGCDCAQMFAMENFVVMNPISFKAKADEALKQFAEDVDALNVMIFDDAQKQLGENSDFQKELDCIRTD